MMKMLGEWLDQHAGRIRGVQAENLPRCCGFLNLGAAFHDEEGTVALMSGGELDSARYHILAVSPWLSFKAFARKCKITVGDRSIAFQADPFAVLELLLRRFQVSWTRTDLPVQAGLFGYFAYDLKNDIEDLPRTAVDDLALPRLCLYAPSLVVVQDRKAAGAWQCWPEWEPKKPAFEGKRERARRLLFAGADPAGGLSFECPGGLRPLMSKRYYLEAVDAIKDYIRAGDIYQANFAQRFEINFCGHAYALFSQLFTAAPAPFYAFIQAGDHQIVSTSPERFIRRSGAEIETRPIKGTRPRGRTREEDRAMSRALRESAKDEAELSMIVDLLRNDFGRVSEGGSVKVKEHKRLEAYPNVFHLVSIIRARLREGMGSVDLLRAAFPGGSITGCPRIRAMEIIDALEPVERHVYTGAIGYVSLHGSMDLSIAIRTATVVGGKLIFSVGGGIVYDSVPMEEYEETLHKGHSLKEALTGGKDGERSRPEGGFVWHNGSILPAEQAFFSSADLGIQYGYGIFETIRAADGAPAYLAEHIRRFTRCWRRLFHTPVPNVDWVEVIRRVIEKNGLEGETAAIKVMATRGSRNAAPYDHGLLVSGRIYMPRPALTRQGGLRLASYPEPRQSPLADYKSLNHLYYILAGRWAADWGADEALILNPDGTVSETNSGNIIALENAAAMAPESPHVLAGVMQEKAFALLAQEGYRRTSRKLLPGDLAGADAVLVTNSLIGAVPAISLDGEDWDEAKTERSRRLSRRLCAKLL